LSLQVKSIQKKPSWRKKGVWQPWSWWLGKEL